MVTTAGSGGGSCCQERPELPANPGGHLAVAAPPHPTLPLHPWVLHGEGDGDPCWIAVPCTAHGTLGASRLGPSHCGCPRAAKGTQTLSPRTLPSTQSSQSFH